MKEHYCSYEQSVKLKELGFDWKCDHYYTYGYENLDSENTNKIVRFHTDIFPNIPRTISVYGLCYSAPRLDQAAAWLRDEKDIVVIAEPDWDYEDAEIHSDYLTGKWYFVVWKDGERVDCNFDPSKEDEEIWLFDTYEQALSAGIDKALELLEKEVKE